MTVAVAGLDGGVVALDARELAGAGPLLLPGAPGWGEAVRLWNGLVDRRPALVVQPGSAEEVAVAVTVAARRRLRLGVKGGGHNVGGLAIADGGLLLDLARLRGVAVDPQRRLARVGAGCVLGDVDRATQAHGLATVLGFVSQVGVAGLTLGGGLGYLTRRFGWTVDNVEAIELVTADGEIRVARRDAHPELFWAARGGGGNFGVATELTYRLHPIGPTVVGGLVGWPFERASEILRAYRAMTLAAPRELAVWLNLMRAPPMPFVPEGWRGRAVCCMAVCYSGDLDRAEAALAPIRALGAPLFDVVAPRPYVEVQSYLDDSEPKGHHYEWKTELAAELPDDFLSLWRELATTNPMTEGQLGILHLAGALQEHADDEAAMGHREARYALGAIGVWSPDDPDGAKHRAWVRAAWQRFGRFGCGGNYVNFQTADEGDARVRAAYGARWERLREIKRRYDPTNLFRENRNILPAG